MEPTRASLFAKHYSINPLFSLPSASVGIPELPHAEMFLYYFLQQTA